MKRYIKKIVDDFNGYTFVFNHNTIKHSIYKYMIHIYNYKGSCVYYRAVEKKWKVDYMEAWFQSWVKVKTL